MHARREGRGQTIFETVISRSCFGHPPKSFQRFLVPQLESAHPQNGFVVELDVTGVQLRGKAMVSVHDRACMPLRCHGRQCRQDIVRSEFLCIRRTCFGESFEK